MFTAGRVKKSVTAVMAALAVTGCASTRGAQNIACAEFDSFALEPKPHAIVQDIQRYGVENRGTEKTRAFQLASASGAKTVDATVGEAIFGMSNADLAREGKRLREELELSREQPVFSVSEGGEGAAVRSMAPPVSPDEILVTSSLSPRNVLLLSGGGQWGAYGAGLFLGMVCSEDVSPIYNPAKQPCLVDTPAKKRVIDESQINFKPLDDMEIGVITGVSTGSLQSLLLMVILDESQLRDTRIAALQQLLDSYAPEKQSDLVDYDGFRAVIFQGSVAGTTALREHVTTVLQKKWNFRDGVKDNEGNWTGDPVPGRQLVDQIAYSPIGTIVGVVEGQDGDFKSVDMRQMVNDILPNERAADPLELEQKRAEATNCVLASTLASSAMPVFHQQLRVVANDEGKDKPKNVTLFDGGVRRSVFISDLGDAFRKRYRILARAMGEELYARADEAGKLPRMYVLRNGPTTSVKNDKVNSVDGAIEQALRAYELLVNELEVGSIASLRLANPYGPILLSTADGSENKENQRRAEDGTPLPGERRKGCDKNGEMFDPGFMVCLQNFGIRRGMELEVDKEGKPIPDFWPISEIEQLPVKPLPTPANDN